MTALYDGGIRYLDSTLEEWFATWEDRGLLDNTIIIITSDHGEGLRQRLARFGGHGDLNEEGLRIPMMVRLPGGARGGERVDSLVSLVDIVPTVLELVNLEPDVRLPGRSLLGAPRPTEEWVFAARSGMRAAVRRDRKVVYRDQTPLLVYDLVEDPEELAPLSPSSDVIAPIITGRIWLMRQRRVYWLESGASAVLGKLTELATAPG